MSVRELFLRRGVVASPSVKEDLRNLDKRLRRSETVRIMLALIKTPTARLRRWRVSPKNYVTALVPGSATLLNVMNVGDVTSEIAGSPFERETLELLVTEVIQTVERRNWQPEAETEEPRVSIRPWRWPLERPGNYPVLFCIRLQTAPPLYRF
jgi:hypothetical protein